MTRRENFEEGFEREWKDAMENVSMDPPKHIWNAIDGKLAYAELSTYKSKNAYYKLAVAALLVLTFSLVIFQYFYFQDKINQSLNAGIINNDAPTPMKESVINGFFFSDEEPLNEPGGPILLVADNREETVKHQVTGGDSSPLLVYQDLTAIKHQMLGEGIATGSIEKEMFVRPVYHFERKVYQSENKYWAGVNLGGGTFDPNYQSKGNSLLSTSLDVNPSAFSLASNQALDTESPSVREGMVGGQTISMGFDFGLKLGRRWLIESGVQYARSDATTSTNVVVETLAFQEVIPVTTQLKGIPQVASVVQREPVVEYDYRDVSLTNQFEFASIPVKAGYMIFNKKFSLQLNAGVLTNIYLGNKLFGTDNEIAEVTLGPGDTSPYRNLSFSGLAGIEFGYGFLKNFDLVVEPNYRHALNSLTKAQSTFVTNPTGFGLSTGIRYNFN